MLQESNSILLPLSWSIDIRKEEGDVMVTYQCYYSCVIKVVHVHFLLVFVSSLMSFLTVIHSFIWYFWLIYLRVSLAQSLDPTTNHVYEVLGEDILRVVEMERVPSSDAMAVMEISIHGNVYVTASGGLR